VIRIGAVVDTFDLGGFELACLDLLRRLDPGRFGSRIYSFRPGALVEVARAAGIPVVVGHDKPPMDRDWREEDGQARGTWAVRLAQLMAADRIDLCLTWAWPEAVEAARSAGVRSVVERVDGPSLAARVPDKSGCTRVIVESRAVRDLLLAQRDRFRLDPRRLVVIRNGVDLDRFDPARIDAAAARAALGIPLDAFVAGTVARLAPEKNLGQLLAAFAQASSADPALARWGRLVLAGPDGGSRDALVQRATDLGIADRVLFTGATSDPAAVLGALDVFCITSYTEGSPQALLEAMAMARPVIATPVGAVLELIDGTALFVDVMAPGATAAAIVDLFHDSALRRRLGTRGREIARHHGVAAQVRHYGRVLEDAFREGAA
jgi:glycosyltransferase involved in cell wall biosynthesis